MAFVAGPPRAWDGASIGLKRFSLRFDDAEREKGFLKSRRNKLLTNAFTVNFVTWIAHGIILSIHLYTIPLARDISEAATYVHRAKCVAIGVNTGILTLSMLCLKAPSIHNHLVEGSLEIMIVFVTLVIMAINMGFTGGLHSTTEILGRDAAMTWDKSCFCETATILLADAYVTATHIALPLRWPFLLIVSVMAVVFYFCTSTLFGGASEGFLTNSVMFCALVFLSSGGSRANEITERKLFVEVAKEKTLRCEAEFRLDREVEAMQTIDSSDSKRIPEVSGNSEVNSLPTTTATKHIFEVFFSGCNEADVTSLFGLGLREHWLIAQQDVLLLPKQILGAGAFGMVVAGLFHNAKVAVKLPYSALQAKSIPNFQDLANELRVLRQCRHPNLVQFYGAILDTQETKLALVLELVDGFSLDFLLMQSGEVLTSLARYDIVVTSCRGLCCLHSQLPKIVHGDLKTTNVLIERRGDSYFAKLADFGLSRLLTRKTRPLGGTLAWMAPEHFNEATPKLSSDVFSFGLLIHCVATGIKPHSGKSRQSVKENLRSGVVPLLEWPGVSSLEAYCKPCTESCLRVPEDLRPPIEKLLESIEAWPVDSEAVVRKDKIAWAAGLRTLQRALQATAKQEKTPDAAKAKSESDGVSASIVSTWLPSSQTSTSSKWLAAVGYKLTPMETQLQMIGVLLQRCNSEIHQLSCCPMHASIRSLMAAGRQFGQRQCNHKFFSDVCWQCSWCGGLSKDAEGDGYCEVCFSTREDEEPSSSYMAKSLSL